MQGTINIIKSPHKTGLIASLLFLILFVVSYFNSFSTLAIHWIGRDSNTYNYGFLVVVCVFYLLFLQKDKFRALAISPFFWAILPLIGSILVWFIARLVDVQKLQFFAIPLILLSSITLCFGLKFLRITLLPIAILYFALPIWDVLWPFLQDITTFVTHANLKLIGKPVFVQGHILQLPGGAFHIDTSCGGLRYLLVSAILSLMYSSMNELSTKQGTGLLIAAILLSFLANWIRVLAVVLIGDATQMESSIVRDHENLGWAVYFLSVLVPLFFITRFISSDYSVPSPPADASDSARSDNTRVQISAYLLAFLAVAAGPASSALVLQFNATESTALKVPEAVAPWSSRFRLPQSENSRWQPIYLNASQELDTEYTNGERAVELHLIHYANQSQDAELINVNNQLFDITHWTAIDNSVEPLDSALTAGRLTHINSMEIASSVGERKLLWYWYQIGSHSTANTIQAKLFQVIGLLEGRADASLVLLATDCDNDCVQAGATIQNFISDMSRELFISLP